MIELQLLFVDTALLVVNKPAGLLSVPGKGDGQLHNLSSLLQQQFADAQVVHRLDQATSGLMLFARGAPVQRLLSMAFEQRQVLKRYEAVVKGVLSQDEGEIDAPLMADWPQRPRQKVDLQSGKPSLTRWRVLHRTSATTRLELEPVTGRSHQLRVHLLSIGHPILGDTLYGDAAAAAQGPARSPGPDGLHGQQVPVGRLHLHATQLRLLHPLSQVELVFDCPAPF